MKYNPLGKSGLMVSELCLGTMVFGEDNARGTSPKDAQRIIHAYLDAGGNHIDTANVYAGGKSEEIIARTLSIPVYRNMRLSLDQSKVTT